MIDISGRTTTTYKAGEFAGFLRSKDHFGGFSNMHQGFPFSIGIIDVDSTESLYQALRYPLHPDHQRYVLAANFSLGAKRRAYEEHLIKDTTPGWVTDGVNVQAMHVCLWLKLISYKKTIYGLFESANNLPIVELSYRDDFWGAKPLGSAFGSDVIGRNILGFLWHDVIEKSKGMDEDTWLPYVAGLSSGLMLFDKPLSELIYLTKPPASSNLELF